MRTDPHPITPTGPRWKRWRRAIIAGTLAILASVGIVARVDATQGTAQIGCSGPAELDLWANAYGSATANPTTLVLIGHTAATVTTPLGQMPYDPSTHPHTFTLPADYHAGDEVFWALAPQVHDPNGIHHTTVLAAEQPCDTTTTTVAPTTTTRPTTTTTAATTTTTAHHVTTTAVTTPTPPPVLPHTGWGATATAVTVAAILVVAGVAMAAARRRVHQ